MPLDGVQTDKKGNHHVRTSAHPLVRPFLPRLSPARTAMGFDVFRGDLPAATLPPKGPPPFRQALGHARSPDGSRIAHATAGHGPVLVKAANGISHLEFDAHSAVWGHLIAELSSDHTLVRHDRRGCGLSDWDVPPARFDDWVDDLAAVVEATGHERFALFGVSDGAAVALAYAARHPTRVSHLVLHGAWARPGVRCSWPGRADPALDDLREVATTAANARHMQQVEAGVDLDDLATRVRCPPLLLHAIDDPEVPLAEAARLAACLPDARLVTLPGMHHLPLADEAAWSLWLREVRAFLPREPDARSPMAALSARERDVLDLLARGCDNPAIAETLGLGEKTVRNHVSNVYRKLGTGNRVRTAQCAREAGLGATFRTRPGC